jgi:hypothetical protein
MGGFTHSARHYLVHEHIEAYTRSARAFLHASLLPRDAGGHFAAARRRVLFLLMTGMLLLSATAWVAVPQAPTGLPSNRPVSPRSRATTPAPVIGQTTVFEMMQHVFREEGVPTRFVRLAEVESLLDPAAVSRSGARGLFQLMPVAARRFGLHVGVGLDERSNPELNTRAAARYLRFLHGRFGSWPLAVAAFNAGEGTVAAAMALTAGKTYDDIEHALPSQTRSYVPRVLALVESPVRPPADDV